MKERRAIAKFHFRGGSRLPYLMIRMMPELELALLVTDVGAFSALVGVATLGAFGLRKQACVKRIQADESGHKHCTGQYFDYWHCVDKCAAEKLFDKLK
ncbi:hypothetical protein KSP39_PZI005922 [Platanthera zijinensis]|uniref:Complex III subunit VI n=1 Tax=Platanthera zijinensis TaxID=2320716 RepID=A0AAP0BS95_9ASPA